MNCRGCGTDVDDHPSPAAVNLAVDEVLQASIEDAKGRGGVCPLCGHSHYVPFYNRETFRTARSYADNHYETGSHYPDSRLQARRTGIRSIVPCSLVPVLFSAQWRTEIDLNRLSAVILLT